MDPKRLTGVALFQGLSKKDLARLGTWTDEVEVAEGKQLAREGSFAYEFFVIEDGTADVTQGDQVIGSMGPGDFFGEIGLLEAERRTASVIATSPMKVIVMTGRDFTDMEAKMPHVAEQIRTAIKERLERDRSA